MKFDSLKKWTFVVILLSYFNLVCGPYFLFIHCITYICDSFKLGTLTGHWILGIEINQIHFCIHRYNSCVGAYADHSEWIDWIFWMVQNLGYSRMNIEQFLCVLKDAIHKFAEVNPSKVTVPYGMFSHGNSQSQYFIIICCIHPLEPTRIWISYRYFVIPSRGRSLARY